MAQLYRLLSGEDDSVFCARVEKWLNKGWKLHGSPSLTFNGEYVVAAQAIIKDEAGDYTGFVSLNDREDSQ